MAERSDVVAKRSLVPEMPDTPHFVKALVGHLLLNTTDFNASMCWILKICV